MVVHWFVIGMIMGSNLGKHKLNFFFFFAKFRFGINRKGQKP